MAFWTGNGVSPARGAVSGGGGLILSQSVDVGPALNINLASPVTIPFANETRAAATHIVFTSDTERTFITPGVYWVRARVSAERISSGSKVLALDVYINGTPSGFAGYESFMRAIAPASLVYDYRVTVAQGDVLTIRALRISGNSNAINTRPGESTLEIAYLGS